MNNIINIFLVDDHNMFLEGVYSILDDMAHINVIGTSNNGNDALKRIPALTVDIVITDIEMPEMNGIQLIKLLKEKNSQIKTIIASSHANSSMIEKAKKQHTDGYILKNTGKIELLQAIHTIYNGGFYFSEEVKKIYSDSLFSPKTAKAQSVTLSPREKEVLQLISEEKKTQDIADTLCISVNTVETHRKNLMRKIGAKSVVGLVKYAIQQGVV